MILRRCAATAAVLTVLSACAPARASSAPATAAGLPATPGGSGPAAVAVDTTRVSVTGRASRSVLADRARIQVAVETEGATAEEASSRNARTMNRVLDAVRGALDGGPDGEGRLETTGYRLDPRYRQDRNREGPPEIVGYQAVNRVVVTVEDVELVGPVLDAALDAGANRVAGLSFFASDTESARLDAVRTATEQARREAEVVAEAMGMEIVGVASVSTSGGGSVPVMRAGVEMQAAMSTPVESGSQSVSATVNVTFLLLPEGSR